MAPKAQRIRQRCDDPAVLVNGENAVITVQIGSELPAYQGFSQDQCTLGALATSPRSTAGRRLAANLKKMLAGHRVSGVS
jgi:hypothetical protein